MFILSSDTMYVLQWPRLLQWRTPSMDENMTLWQAWQHVLPQELSGAQVFWANSNRHTRNLGSGELHLEAFFDCFPSCMPYQFLPHITLCWAKFLIDQAQVPCHSLNRPLHLGLTGSYHDITIMRASELYRSWCLQFMHTYRYFEYFLGDLDYQGTKTCSP